MTHAFDAAVAAVRAGADPAAEARKMYEELTEAEQLGLLDGDVPCWHTASSQTDPDNVQFGLRAVDQAGHRSPVAFPQAVST